MEALEIKATVLETAFEKLYQICNLLGITIFKVHDATEHTHVCLKYYL